MDTKDIGSYKPDAQKEAKTYKEWEETGYFHACTLESGECVPNCPNTIRRQKAKGRRGS